MRLLHILFIVKYVFLFPLKFCLTFVPCRKLNLQLFFIKVLKEDLAKSISTVDLPMSLIIENSIIASSVVVVVVVVLVVVCSKIFRRP